MIHSKKDIFQKSRSWPTSPIHLLQVKLKNKSLEKGFFKIDVISSNADFNGDYPQTVEVDKRSESTIDIAQLIVR